MHIQGPTQVHGPQPINAPHRTQTPQRAVSIDRVSGADQLDISREAEIISRIRDVPDIRTDRVAEIRARIEAGTYETEHKLEVAVERLLDEIG